MSRDFSQSRPYKFGDWGQKLVLLRLKEEGWHVVPSYDFSGKDSKAPAIQGLEGCLVMPDIDCSKNGLRRWVEVKTKQIRPRYFVWDNREVHGIALRHFEQYERVQHTTGAEVWLFVLEKELNNILCAPLSRLKAPNLHKINRYENPPDKGGSIYFDIRAFDLFGIPDQYCELWKICDGRWLLDKKGGQSA